MKILHRSATCLANIEMDVIIGAWQWDIPNLAFGHRGAGLQGTKRSVSSMRFPELLGVNYPGQRIQSTLSQEQAWRLSEARTIRDEKGIKLRGDGVFCALISTWRSPYLTYLVFLWPKGASWRARLSIPAPEGPRLRNVHWTIG